MDALIYFMLFSFMYFMPTLVARPGRRGSVFVINLFTGWTIIGWVLALFLATRSREAMRKAGVE